MSMLYYVTVTLSIGVELGPISCSAVGYRVRTKMVHVAFFESEFIAPTFSRSLHQTYCKDVIISVLGLCALFLRPSAS